ncbi:hypothetical protein OGATHE_000955 [Ogataea polymorpha]|uniref:Uncharacterized protein n=1 Tax=Ogataea polymorpha TaxID=460523 RepID=A0A9P8TGG2_9ASCO|nr:hypothetical protein OGATHE_000955 [Ogataea polymorpha]
MGAPSNLTFTLNKSTLSRLMAAVCATISVMSWLVKQFRASLFFGSASKFASHLERLLRLNGASLDSSCCPSLACNFNRSSSSSLALLTGVNFGSTILDAWEPILI